MEDHKLELAPEETKVVILETLREARKQKKTETPQRELKYLGIVLKDVDGLGKYLEMAVNKSRSFVHWQPSDQETLDSEWSSTIFYAPPPPHSLMQ